MKKYIGEILLLLTAIIWGSGYIGMKVGLAHLTVFQIMAGRFALATIFLTIIFHKNVKLITKRVLWKGIILGVILFLAFTVQTIGLDYTTPSKNAFLTAVNVMIVPLIAFVIYKRKFDGFEMLAALLAIIGIGFLSLQGSMQMNIGDFLSLASAIGFAFDIFYTNMFVKTEDALALTIVQLFTAAVLSIIAVIVLGEVPTTISSEEVSVILYLGIVCTTIAYVCQNIGMQYADPTKSALILSTEALFGTIFSVIILHEILTSRMIIGSFIILIAIIIAEVKPAFKHEKKLESKVHN
ncbi:MULTISPECIES: DMT family transporter [unclassified Rummeliibacillus]|uniref:DMT family transporter n=1 Tax=unclassified Rummeliibacillus TaxID=2622809 RepID=UPI000E6747F9|nr:MULTISPECIES: DMT family transporter [unclassified Rummeliibacillus]RIJ68816.1 DMT family transporter [Rummeliibacillus sp. POC4]RPJ94688.1 DMT family transporter [Rummeliibacillus sp. TYF005]